MGALISPGGILRGGVAAPSWSPLSLGYSQFAARLATPPTLARKQAYDRLIYGLEQAGVWSKLDALYIFAAADEATALTNLVQSSYGATAVGSPTFLADLGYTGASGKYINTGFNPTTASSPQYARNSAHVSVWGLTSAQKNGPAMGQLSSADVAIYPRWTDDVLYARPNGTSGNLNVGNVKDGAGLTTAIRTGANATKVYRNGGVFTDTDTGASTALVNQNFTFLLGQDKGVGGDTNYSGRIAAGCFGSQLSDAEVSALYLALRPMVTGGRYIVAHGDSITAASAGLVLPFQRDYPYHHLVARTRIETDNLVTASVSRGINGQSFHYVYDAMAEPNDLIADAPINVDPWRTDEARLVVFAGTNGIWSTLGNHTAAEEYADFQEYIEARIAAGWNPDHIVVCTMLDREGGFGGTIRADYNALLVGGASTYGYRVARLDQNANIGDNGDQANTTYFADAIHPTQAGHTEIASVVYAAMFA